jgi:hypothetical protein
MRKCWGTLFKICLEISVVVVVCRFWGVLEKLRLIRVEVDRVEVFDKVFLPCFKVGFCWVRWV